MSPGRLRRTALIARMADRATGTTRPSHTTEGRGRGREGGGIVGRDGCVRVWGRVEGRKNGGEMTEREGG